MVKGRLFTFESGILYNYNEVKATVLLSGLKNKLTNVQPLHLYLTDNQRILKGDWCIKDYDKLYKATEHESAYNMTGDSRVICCTDTDLRHDIIINFHPENCVEENLPNFHQLFIETYIDRYNRGEQLTNNIEPELEIFGEKGKTRFLINEDNIMSVLIKVFKVVGKTYSRAELDKHLLAVMNLGMGLRQSQLNGSDLRSGNDVLDKYKLDNL